MNRSGFLASIVLLLAIGAGAAFFWWSRGRDNPSLDHKSALPPPVDRVVNERPTTPPDSTSTSGSAVPAPEVDDVAFTYVADDVTHSVSMKECDSLRHRLQMYADLDYAQPASDYDVFEFVLGSYEIRDFGVAVTDDEVKADYARLFETDEFEDKLTTYLQLERVNRADFDWIVRGRIAARKLASLLGSSAVCCDAQTFEEIAGFGTQFKLDFIHFDAAPFRAQFSNLPPDKANEEAFKLCRKAADEVKNAIRSLNDEHCKSEAEGISKQEDTDAESEIAAKPDATDAEKDSIRGRHRDAATNRIEMMKRSRSGKAYEEVAKQKDLTIDESLDWFGLPSPLKPQLPPDAHYFQKNGLATRLLVGQFGGVYEDKPNGCYLARKTGERNAGASPSTAEIVRGRYRWSHRNGFKRELTLRYPALMHKYQYAPVKLGSSPEAIPGGPGTKGSGAPSDPQAPVTPPKKKAMKSSPLPDGVPDSQHDVDQDKTSKPPSKDEPK
jgi:hypothetical protein